MIVLVSTIKYIYTHVESYIYSLVSWNTLFSTFFTKTLFFFTKTQLRCGADRVYVAFRKGIQGMRAVPEEVELAVEEKCEFLPFMQVQSVVTNEATGRVRLVEFARYLFLFPF